MGQGTPGMAASLQRSNDARRRREREAKYGTPYKASRPATPRRFFVTMGSIVGSLWLLDAVVAALP